MMHFFLLSTLQNNNLAEAILNKVPSLCVNEHEILDIYSFPPGTSLVADPKTLSAKEKTRMIEHESATASMPAPGSCLFTFKT
jgi:hypothetical protein